MVDPDRARAIPQRLGEVPKADGFYAEIDGIPAAWAWPVSMTPTALGALQVDEEKLTGHVDEMVRSSFSVLVICAIPPILLSTRTLHEVHERHRCLGDCSSHSGL